MNIILKIFLNFVSPCEGDKERRKVIYSFSHCESCNEKEQLFNKNSPCEGEKKNSPCYLSFKKRDKK